MKDLVSKFEKKIGISFNNKDLLLEALTHRSYLNENKNWKLPHNERLEFLGDAVLELVVSGALFLRFPNFDEGKMTGVRAALVNTQMLARIAKGLNFDDFIIMSRGEKKELGKARESLLADVFEAVLGSIYIDSGMERASEFVKKNVLIHTDEVIENNLDKDIKSEFQEKAQAEFKITPTYKVVNETGPDHKKKFVVGVFLNSKKIAEGSGESKQEAEEDAAKNGLYEFEKIGDNRI